jgi:Zn-dependent metalloprotease
MQVRSYLALAVSAALAASPALADPRARDAALKKLQDAARGAAAVSMHRSTGAARFVSLPPAARGLGQPAARTERDKKAQSAAFFRSYGAAIGVSDPAGLRHVSTVVDALGETHLTYRQFHDGVPVFAGTVKTHFDAAHELKAVNGTAVPDLAVGSTPTWSAAQAAELALSAVVRARGPSDALGIGSTKLYVYREGLAKGVPGDAQLAWEVEVTDGAGVRDLVYVGAHTGKVIETVAGIHDEMNRRAYDGHELAFAPKNYPNAAYWTEGQRLPTASEEANNMIVSSEEVYDFFKNAFGRDSFDGQGATMDAIFDRGYSCPNASWNGTFISFCPGTTTDDVTAHEWGHAYTQYTHGLIYAWQPGALNEAYSDIWGEIVDAINGRGGDAPDAARSAGACSTLSPPVGKLVVTAPASLAGEYFAQSASFGPRLNEAGITGEVVAALDPADAAGPTTLDACSPLTNAAAVLGKIALVNRGACNFTVKVKNAQNAGALAVIVANNAANGLPGMGGSDASVTIPSLGVQQATGDSIRAALAGAEVVTAKLVAQPGSDASVRWLMGEDSAAFSGALRDMWNPTCYSNPGKVTDRAYYVCDYAGDNGGVHTNSGVPNHAFALLVDGGSYNGQTIAGIGLTKAAHLYFRAADVYQVEDSDFADHATALESSCADLTGATLPALTGGASGETITAADCAEVARTIAAVELRTPPTFCGFRPLLDPQETPQCGTGTSGAKQAIQLFSFEAGASGWTSATFAAAPGDFTPREWTWLGALPNGRPGSAFFAPDPNVGTCAPGGDESGVLSLTSPAITLPGTTEFARATFWHWVATEAGFDGGNVKVSVNGGSWQLLPPSAFTYNGYNALLETPAAGNTNPLAGQPAWTGTDAGTLKSGTWGRSHVDLGTFAKAGDRVQLRFELGTDGCGGRGGWYVDDVEVFSCTPNAVTVAVEDTAYPEGDAGVTTRGVTVRLSAATVQPVAVRYAIVDGTAQHGNDFEVAATSGTIVVPAGRTTASIAVGLKGDSVPEGDEAFLVRITGVTGATLADGEAVVTILDDDGAPPGQN